MSHSVTFQLANGQDRFYPGNVVSGHVTFTLNEEVTSVKEVIVSITGKSRLRWTEHRNKQTYVYSNSERYFKHKVQLLNATSGSSTLQQGTYTYPFSFQIPADIPSSFTFSSCATAAVEYYVKGTIKRSGLHFNIKEKHVFHVLGGTPLTACPSDAMVGSR